MQNFRRVFGDTKPVIAMVHLGALPGAPLHDAQAGLEGLVSAARADLQALQAAGFDAIMFGNENDRPYEFNVDTASTATMGYVIGRLRGEITLPFGVNVLWDPMATVALGAATWCAWLLETPCNCNCSAALGEKMLRRTPPPTSGGVCIMRRNSWKRQIPVVRYPHVGYGAHGGGGDAE